MESSWRLVHQSCQTTTAGSLPGMLHPCGHCGGWHTGTCYRIKAIEYWPDGTIKRVEYHDSYPPPVSPLPPGVVPMRPVTPMTPWAETLVIPVLKGGWQC